MARKKIKSYIEDWITLVWYVWESLRNNPEYKADYKKYLDCLNNPKIKLDHFTIKTQLEFLSKYGIIPLDPSVDFPKEISLTKKKNKNPIWKYFVEDTKVVCLEPGMNIPIISKLKLAQEIPLILPILINIDAPSQIILEEISCMIKELKKKRRAPSKKNIFKPRLSEIKRYHQVYNLLNSGKSYREVSRIVYPRQNDDDYEYQKKKIIRDKRNWIKLGLSFKDNPKFLDRMAFGSGPITSALIGHKPFT